MVNLKLAVSYLFSVIVIAAIILFTDLSKVFEQIAQFGVIETLIGLVLVIITYFFRAVIWQQLLLPFSKVSFKNSFHITVIGFFLNNFLPLRAGEFARAFLLNKKHEIGKLKIFSTIIIERIIEGLVLVLFFVIAIIFLPEIPADLMNIFILFLLFFLVLFGAFIFSGITQKILVKIFGRFKFFREKISIFFEELFVGEKAIRSGLKENLVIWGSTIALWAVNFVLYYFVALVLGIEIGFFELVVVLVVSSLSTVIPSAPGYIGTFEAGFVLAFAAFGLSSEQAISMAIIVHLLIFVGTTLLGFVSLNSLKISLNDLLKMGSKTKEAK